LPRWRVAITTGSPARRKTLQSGSTYWHNTIRNLSGL
jgi:hypothetical protein